MESMKLNFNTRLFTMSKENNYCVIMAGGVGSRFWPLSKSKSPKQFLDILGTGRTLIQQTYDRFVDVCEDENFYIVTSDDYKDIVAQQLPEIPISNILLEPLRRNTSACIAYASYRIHKQNANANIIVSPADHLILQEKKFLRAIDKGLERISKDDVLLTLGLKPTRAETGYGYIQIEDLDVSESESICKVKTFTEKPDKEMAQVFFESGEFYWNSGIFLWKSETILKSFSNLLPEIKNSFDLINDKLNTPEEQNAINEIYPNLENVSIDYGILEKADNVYVLCSDFGWSDLGTWGSLYENTPKDEHLNAKQGGHVFCYDTESCVINTTKDKLVVLQGLKDYIVVETKDSLLVCKKNEEQSLRNIINDIRFKLGEEYV